jgi:predicted TIM-barrel fold metal-dependent hydrolase
MKGMKMHPTLNNYEADSPKVYPVMERIQKYGVPLLIHSWSDNLSHPSRIGKLAKLFPDVPIIMGHMGYEAYTEAAFLTKELPNVYLDTTGFFNAERTLPTVVRIAGNEKIMFGTDSPALNARVEVARIKFADISEEAKKAIFYENAKKLLKL